MSGISGSGLISGIDTAALIEQLIQAASRPRQLAEQRLISLQTQQAAILDINNSLSSLRSAAASFRVDRLFDQRTATSTQPDSVTATASARAQTGSFPVIIDRLVSTQQSLSRGFADSTASPVGATSFTFEPEDARLDRDIALADFNDGNGITRGVITLTDSAGNTADVDLSRVATVNELIDAVNTAGLDVVASVDGNSIRFENLASMRNRNSTRDVLGSLGFSQSAVQAFNAGSDSEITGSSIYGLSSRTALRALNDGNGVFFNDTVFVNSNPRDFQITLGGTSALTLDVGLGERLESPRDEAGEIIEGSTPEQTAAQAATLGDVVDRINQAVTDAGLTAADFRAEIDRDNGSLRFITGNGYSVDGVSSDATARDLGIAGLTVAADGDALGDRVFAPIGTTLVRNLGGGPRFDEDGNQIGDGIGDDGTVNVRLRDGSVAFLDLDLSTIQTVQDLIDAINSDPDNPGNLIASLNSQGTGLRLTDNSLDDGDPQISNLIVTGAGAESLGLATDPAGLQGGVLEGRNLQRRYMSEATLTASLNGGDGIGTGTFRITDSSGVSRDVVIGQSDDTLGDVIDAINDAAGDQAQIRARINDSGDGILIEDTGDGANALIIEDVSGSVARQLRIAGQSANEPGDNDIDGSFEVTVEFDQFDTLTEVARKINDANAPVTATVINDGAGASPFRLSFVARASGVAGRTLINTNGFDLGLQTLDEGSDARAFYGSNTAAGGVLLSSSTNDFENVAPGVTIDANATTDGPAEITVERDQGGIEEQFGAFVEAFNRALSRIDNATRFVEETGERGALLGDGTAITLRSQLAAAITRTNDGFGGRFQRLTDIGIRVVNDGGGQIEFDTDRFRAAMTEDPQAVQDLLTRRRIETTGRTIELQEGISVNNPEGRTTFAELGAMPLLEEFLNTYSSGFEGVLSQRSNNIDTQIQNQQDRIQTLQEGLDRERFRLEQQFVQMEQALASLQSQQASIASLGSIGG